VKTGYDRFCRTRTDRPEVPYALRFAVPEGDVVVHDLLRGEVRNATDRLQEIPGMVPPLFALPEGCAFAPRCSRADDLCRRERPAYEQKRSAHWAACWHSDG